ncbi:hypothetical protein [Niallia taxi]|uniref:Uncharacterized protein n=1 Tax=Niallia taxi TaxID=2499688 RepID=A0A437K469_9BACI|nr:hypothetical protein [Niallia taxi]RVT57408.1 hypothetical protein EM808_24595 [Niallia taxi]
MSLKPSEIYLLTPREFTLLLNAEREKHYDSYERQSHFIIMSENAKRAKRSIKASDLYKRPADEKAEAKLQEGVEKAQHASEWLAQFEQFSGKEVSDGRP